jgi:hypothetical protein
MRSSASALKKKAAAQAFDHMDEPRTRYGVFPHSGYGMDRREQPTGSRTQAWICPSKLQPSIAEISRRKESQLQKMKPPFTGGFIFAGHRFRKRIS